MVSLSDIEYEKMKCDIQNLENENATLKAQLSVVTERVKPLIVSFLGMVLFFYLCKRY